MKKISFKKRLKVVGDFLEGKGSALSLARKYHVNQATVINWLQLYKGKGVDALQTDTQSGESQYSLVFRLKVLKWKETHQASSSETARHFNIFSSSTVRNWLYRYNKGGTAGLAPKKGPGSMAAQKKQTKKNPQAAQDKAFKDLQKENHHLKLENEFLKKFLALNRKK